MTTEIVTTIAQLRERIVAARGSGRFIGCVPTMGALHAGHGALIDRARSECDVVVVTIFVNPIQFDRNDDYEAYGRNLAVDLRYCQERNVDYIFAPAVEEMYPDDSVTFVDVPKLTEHLCGAFRPGHFRGVATVVAKLFSIVQPDKAYFGEKDAQQLAVIERMVSDLNFPLHIVPVPTVREKDGLALSSRNQRLTSEERHAAPILFEALSEGHHMIAEGERNPATVKSAIMAILETEPSMNLEYLEVVDGQMQPVGGEIESDVRIMAAAWLGSVRLIDNVFCRVTV